MKDKKEPIKRSKKPWPTKDAMEQVYDQNLWGENDTLFYSGIGSHHPDIIEPYITRISSFLSSFEEPPRVCDLGCGDFNVGKDLVKYTSTYIAADIVESLIVYNSQKFDLENVEFRCLDIATDPLPSGDIVILRQVFQHLSNAEIKSILKKLNDFKYLILTEHIPQENFESNLDIISGQGTRLKKKSGIDLTTAPFNFQFIEKQTVLSLPAKDHMGIIETSIFRLK
ncbi:class I SAM-dependent methyltransferase [Gramella lutea]|uniref:Class I SAM-dependent methyltransferase n=1 Tax=Christiangramia lutea TaxID=1607951 RepID=A0A9X1V1T6_9FLAO|nr:methyltransferase domain-containing protein [Christiangramia lutea]MCH4822096.1 class I SAM-dependent methyltransferase [Christiangramia lutea]